MLSDLKQIYKLKTEQQLSGEYVVRSLVQKQYLYLQRKQRDKQITCLQTYF